MGRRKKKKITGRLLLPLLFFSLFLLVFLVGITSVSRTTEQKERENIENAVVQAAVFCYGTEGAYPESLEYLQKHYGVRYNKKKYVVEYEVVGKNIRPQVRVMSLAQEEK